MVVENPIIPAIASSSVLYNFQSHENGASCKPTCFSSEESSCRSETNKYSNAHASARNNYQPVNPSAYHSFNGRELVLQFENLQCTQDDDSNIEKVKKVSPKYSSALTLKAVKNRPLKKAVISKGVRSKKQRLRSYPAKFVLKPSKLNRCVKAAFNRSYTECYHSNPSATTEADLKDEKELSLYHDFSIECSKELETIELASSALNECPLRPRSSSLPASGALASQPTSSPSISPGKNGSSESKQNSTTRRSRRKHLSKCDTKVSNNDLNSTINDQRVTSRANKRRKSPPEHSITNVQQSGESFEGDRDKSRDNLDASIDRLADYLEDSILLPKKMSFMAEMMYT